MLVYRCRSYNEIFRYFICSINKSNNRIEFSFYIRFLLLSYSISFLFTYSFEIFCTSICLLSYNWIEKNLLIHFSNSWFHISWNTKSKWLRIWIWNKIIPLVIDLLISCTKIKLYHLLWQKDACFWLLYIFIFKHISWFVIFRTKYHLVSSYFNVKRRLILFIFSFSIDIKHSEIEKSKKSNIHHIYIIYKKYSMYIHIDAI